MTLGAGQKWSNIEIRFRQLASNSGPAASFNNSGTLLIFNGSGSTNIGALETESQALTGVYTDDTFNVTLAADGADEWQKLIVDFTNAPTFNSAAITAIRFDPVGNDSAKNFQVDYVRVTAVPEPSSLALLGVGGLGLVWHRRRRK